MPRLRPGLCLLALLVIAVGCDAVGPVNEPPPPPPSEPTPLAALLGDIAGFSSFAQVAGQSGLSGGATTLAPDDDAFELMGPESLSGLRSATLLEKVARRHVLTQPLDPAALADGDQLATLEGTPILVRVTDEGVVFLGDARLGGVIGSTPAGPVYRLSRVLRDHLAAGERVRASPLLSRSDQVFGLAGVSLAQPGTYFIPANPGYDLIPGGTESYLRVANRALTRKTLLALYIPGRVLTVAQLRAEGTVETAAGSTLQISERDGLTILGRDEARVLVSNVRADGSIVHIIDTPPQGHLTLLERVSFLSETATFALLIRQAGLQATLDGPGPFTMFATVEAGFDSLGARGRSAVLNEERLRSAVARFQIAEGDIPSSALVNGADFVTLSGQSIRVRPDPLTDRTTAVSRASPTAVLDLPAVNGRLHVMRSLLNPVVPTFDQLALSGFGTFRAIIKRVDYQRLLDSQTLLSVVGPASVTEQYLQPGFECRARQLVEDHVLLGQGAISPRSTRFTTLSGQTLDYVFDSGTFSLLSGAGSLLGASEGLYLNSPLPSGGVLHGSRGRLRWYGSGGPAQNLPAC